MQQACWYYSTIRWDSLDQVSIVFLADKSLLNVFPVTVSEPNGFPCAVMTFTRKHKRSVYHKNKHVHIRLAYKMTFWFKPKKLFET